MATLKRNSYEFSAKLKLHFAKLVLQNKEVLFGAHGASMNDSVNRENIWEQIRLTMVEKKNLNVYFRPWASPML